MRITQLPVWQKLQSHQQKLADMKISACFQEDTARFQKYSLEAAGLFLDYSRNHLQAETLELLLELASGRHLEQGIEDLLTGKMVNKSEQRPALHTALRYSGSDPLWVQGVDIIPLIHQTLSKMYLIADQIRSGQYLGFSGQPIDTILHFGIGGSDLGPLMVFEALNDFVDKGFHYQFFSYQDPDFVQQCLANYNPATTLIIVASKSFTTTETLANAEVAKSWLKAAVENSPQASRQMIGVTAKIEKAQEWGIAPEQILPVWDWVGGRYSVWSAMSLIIAIAIGPDHFKEFLAGAEQLDRHFGSAPLHLNMPVILGLIDVWYNNFFGISNRATIPYGRKLHYFPHHLQQVSMESLGKRVSQEGLPVDCTTGFVIWGGIAGQSMVTGRFYFILRKLTASRQLFGAKPGFDDGLSRKTTD